MGAHGSRGLKSVVVMTGSVSMVQAVRYCIGALERTCIKDEEKRVQWE